MFPIIRFASLLSTKSATTSTCEARILFGMFYILIDRGGPVNRTSRMAPDHVSETPMLRSFFDSGSFAPCTPVDLPEYTFISEQKKHCCRPCIEVRHHVALIFQILIPPLASFLSVFYLAPSLCCSELVLLCLHGNFLL